MQAFILIQKKFRSHVQITTKKVHLLLHSSERNVDVLYFIFLLNFKSMDKENKDSNNSPPIIKLDFKIDTEHA